MPSISGKILTELPLKFKTERQSREFFSGQMHVKLVRVVGFVGLWISHVYGCHPEVTDIFRTDEEQRALYPHDPERKSVHQFWRGCDIVARELGRTEHRYIRDVINSLFPLWKAGARDVHLPRCRLRVAPSLSGEELMS